MGEGCLANVDPTSGADFITAEVAAEGDLETGAGTAVALAATEDVSGCVGIHIEADSVVDSEAPNDARLKKARKAEAMETATAEPQAFPEKKMRRADGVLTVESGAETIVGSAGLESGEIKSRAKRTDEARVRRHAKRNQRQSARKASTSDSLN